jgi:hypothetical protein
MSASLHWSLAMHEMGHAFGLLICVLFVWFAAERILNIHLVSCCLSIVRSATCAGKHLHGLYLPACMPSERTIPLV